MKKLFNYALLAAALLVGVNVNAQNVVEVTIGEQTNGYATLSAALQSIYEAAKVNIAPNKTEATIKLLDNASLEWDANWMPGTDPKLELNEGEYIKIDMNGHNIDNAVRFNLHRAGIELAGEGNFNSTAAQTFNAYGDDQNVAAEYGYSKIIIGKDVTLTMLTHYALGILNNGGKKNDKYFAAGVQVDVYGEVVSGYGISASGNLQLTPSIEPTYTCPVINIHKDAKFIGGIYAAGYAIWNLEGYIEGATAVYAKSGVINVNGGTLVGTGEYAEPKPNGNGADETGAAISLDTHGSYAGEIELHISGDATIKSENGNGIEEFVTKGTDNTGQPIDDHCESITITSGTIIGAEGKSSITTTEEVKENGVSVGGGTFNSDITEYLGDDNIVTPVTNPDGTTSYVIATKDPNKNWKDDITTAQAGDYIKLGQDADQTIGSGSAPASVEAEYLVAEKNAKVTIPEGKTLTVGEIVMSKDAQIVVEKGAYLIVEGTKGIVANQASNIILKSEEGAPAYFLLDPQVTSNKTPKSTVNYTSKAWYVSSSSFQYQYFGAPMVGGTIEKVIPYNDYSTVLYVWNKTAWQEAGNVKKGEGGTIIDNLDYSLFNKPFGFYAMISNNPNKEAYPQYEITGRLYGNTDPEVPVINGWVPLSNGFTANMNGDALIAALGSTTIQKSAWYPTQQADGTLKWTGYNEMRELEKVEPMGTFMVKNNGATTNVNLNYNDLVWTPATTTPSQAPRANKFAKATVRVEGCGFNDIITVAEDDKFSSDFDNGFDTEKYENVSIRFYVNAEKEYDIFATDNIENTFVGLNTTKAGKYTISFEDVNANFVLVDNKTNARIEMVEGNTYEFLAEAGEDAYRFQIVTGAKAPTDMQKTNAAVKANKALINGQIVISNGERFFNVLGAEVK